MGFPLITTMTSLTAGGLMFKHIRNTNIVELDGVPLPGIWPIINEYQEFTNIIAVGNKNGIDEKLKGNLKIVKDVYPKAKYIFSCQNGPFLVGTYKGILREFDGHMTLDFNPENSKALQMNHSMMVRSMPYFGNFWEPSDEKVFDYSILTKVGDNNAKKWDRTVAIVQTLDNAGFEGIVVNQDELPNRIPNELRNMKHVLYSPKMPEGMFCEIQKMARVGVFPNAIDAFPKHIIECVLANKPVIISKDLLIGRSVIFPDYGTMVDFDIPEGREIAKSYVFMKKRKPEELRDKWLAHYGFDALSKKWAQELDRKFGVDAKRVYFLNHIERIEHG